MQIASFLSTQGRRMRYAALPFICGAVIAGLAIPNLTIAQSGKNDAVYIGSLGFLAISFSAFAKAMLMKLMKRILSKRPSMAC